jgi:hypothetical protein
MECLGVGNNYCGKWVNDPQFPNDNICDKCAEKIETGEM